MSRPGFCVSLQLLLLMVMLVSLLFELTQQRGLGFSPRSEASFRGQRGNNDQFFAPRAAQTGFGKPQSRGKYSGEMSAFRNLFGQDIVQSAGIYDSFGKPKPDNVALIAQSRPAKDRVRLGESRQRSAANDMERYRKHPFSTIRLSPVRQVSGVAVQAPFTGNSQRDDELRDKAKELFVENRARSFRRSDPFERPISKSDFPLPSVNERITLDLPESVSSPERPKSISQLRSPSADENFLVKPLKSNGNPFSGPGIPAPGPPEGAFSWSKPVSIPDVKPSNSSEVKGRDKDNAKTRASLINIKPGDSLTLPKTKRLKLPSLPSANEGGKKEYLKNNTLESAESNHKPNTTQDGQDKPRHTSEIESLENGSNKSSAVLASGSLKETPFQHLETNQKEEIDDGYGKEGKEMKSEARNVNRENSPEEEREVESSNSLEIAPNSVFGETVDWSENKEADSNWAIKNGSTTFREKIPNPSLSQEGPRRHSGILSVNKPNVIGAPAEGTLKPTVEEEENPWLTLVASPAESDDPKPNSKGRYDVTVLTNEAITKKSGDLGLADTSDIKASRETGGDLRVSPIDIPATKTVVERTIEDGSETVVRNEKRLRADDSGFILTDDLYSDEVDAGTEDVTEKNSFAENEDARIRTDVNQDGQKLQSIPSFPSISDRVQHASGNSERDLNDKQQNEIGSLLSFGSTERYDSSNLKPISHDLSDTETDDYKNDLSEIEYTRGTNSGEDGDLYRSGPGIGSNDAEKPPVGSGYLLSGGYFDQKEPNLPPLPPPPISPLPPPTLPAPFLARHDDEENEGYDLAQHATGTNRAPKLGTRDTLAQHEENLKRMLKDEAEPRMDIQTSDGDHADGREGLDYALRPTGDPSVSQDLENGFEDGAYSPAEIGTGGLKRGGILTTSGTVIEEEHIGLEELKRMNEEGQGQTTPSYNAGSRDEDGLNDFSDYNFETFGKQGYPFKNNQSNSPADSNRVGAEGRDSASSFEDTNGGSNFQLVDPSENRDSLPEDFIDVGFNSIKRPMEKMKRDNENKEDQGRIHDDSNGDQGPEVVGRDKTRTDVEEDNTDPDFFTGDFIDYENYEDPYYNYEYATPTDRDDTFGAPPTSGFLASPFQSMFGRTVDQTEQGSFGSLFQNLGHSQRARGGASRGGASKAGWGLFDDSLGQIIKTRPSLNLFSG